MGGSASREQVVPEIRGVNGIYVIRTDGTVYISFHISQRSDKDLTSV